MNATRALITVVAGTVAAVAGQKAPELPTFRVAVDIVSIDVVATDRDGRIVGRFEGGEVLFQPGETRTLSAQASLQGLNWWSWGYGYLYTVSTALKVDGRVVDVVRTRTGFRKTEFGKGVVKLNGRRIDEISLILGNAEEDE